MNSSAVIRKGTPAATQEEQKKVVPKIDVLPVSQYKNNKHVDLLENNVLVQTEMQRKVMVISSTIQMKSRVSLGVL